MKGVTRTEEMQLVCFVPYPQRDVHVVELGALAVPTIGRCDIDWHIHLWRPYPPMPLFEEPT